MKKWVVLLFLVLSQCSQTLKREPSNLQLEQLDVSKNISQLVRSNAPHYWEWIKDQQEQYPQLTEFLSASGFVLGDAHLGNFGPYFVDDLSGVKSVQFVPVDFDDAGEAPFVLDFVRFLIATEAYDKRTIKKKQLLEAYLYGLKNPHKKIAEHLPLPVQRALQLPASEVLKSQDDYTRRHTEGAMLKYQKNDLVKYTGNLRPAIESALQPALVLDVGQKIIHRGGSKNALRLWVLAEKNGRKMIIELKEYQNSAVNEYSPQKTASALMPHVYRLFWPGLQPTAYSLMAIGNASFWVRERQPSFFELPERGDSNSDRLVIEEYSATCAMQMGQIHGRQPGGAELLNQLQKTDLETFKKILEAPVEDYLKILNQAMK